MTAVLIVAHSPSTRDLLHAHLGGAGFAIRSAASVAEALVAVRREPPDAVLLDVHALDFLRGYRPDGRAPVLLLAGSEEHAATVRGLELGADGCVQKPLRLGELVARIRAVLRRSRAAA